MAEDTNKAPKRRSNAGAARKEADKKLDTETVIDMMAEKDDVIAKQGGQIDALTNTVNQLIHKVQRVDSRQSGMDSIHVESDRTFAKTSFEDIEKFCKSKSPKDQFVIFEGYSYGIDSGSQRHMINEVRCPVAPLTVNNQTTKPYTGPGADIAQSFLKERGDYRTGVRVFQIEAMPIYKADQDEGGTKFFKLARIMETMERSKAVLLATDDIESFHELGNCNIMPMAIFKRCLLKEAKVQEAVAAIYKERTQRNVELDAELTGDQQQAGDYAKVD